MYKSKTFLNKIFDRQRRRRLKRRRMRILSLMKRKTRWTRKR
jgi:hypothetical protein